MKLKDFIIRDDSGGVVLRRSSAFRFTNAVVGVFLTAGIVAMAADFHRRPGADFLEYLSIRLPLMLIVDLYVLIKTLRLTTRLDMERRTYEISLPFGWRQRGSFDQIYSIDVVPNVTQRSYAVILGILPGPSLPFGWTRVQRCRIAADEDGDAATQFALQLSRRTGIHVGARPLVSLPIGARRLISIQSKKQGRRGKKKKNEMGIGDFTLRDDTQAVIFHRPKRLRFDCSVLILLFVGLDIYMGTHYPWNPDSIMFPLLGIPTMISPFALIYMIDLAMPFAIRLDLERERYEVSRMFGWRREGSFNEIEAIEVEISKKFVSGAVYLVIRTDPSSRYPQPRVKRWKVAVDENGDAAIAFAERLSRTTGIPFAARHCISV